jgi:preprotein translocase subunit SecA
MVSKSIERAQKKVEENNFGMRKRLLEYDDVMNAQRKAIYRKRKNALFGDRLDIDVDNMFYEICETIVEKNRGVDFQEFELELLRIIGVSSPVTEQEYKTIDHLDLTEKVYANLRDRYDRKCINIAEKGMPQIKHVYETMSDKYKNIVFPLTDNRREMQLIVNLEDAYSSEGKTITKTFEKNVILSKIDEEWKEHLREMDDLRSAVNNATYEQKDPLVIYKLESYNLFRDMLDRLNQEAVELLMLMDLPQDQKAQSTNQENRQNNYERSNSTSSSTRTSTQGYQQAIANSFSQEEKKQPVVADPKVSRNDPCPCGSGKKYKQCHGK